ncbi:hypothetical protein [Streptomyces sp. URMC 123]|uniref:hypothetical protein n=1 Tax=Streptomyces sp. URMC 123 TaxID=3423403 RepID=UPI003F1AC104
MLSTGQPGTPSAGTAPPRRRVLLVARAQRLDSLLVGRRVAAHLTEVELIRATAVSGRSSSPWAAGPPFDAALVCDEPEAADALHGAGVPVVFVHCGHEAAPPPPVAAAVREVHRPGVPAASNGHQYCRPAFPGRGPPG